jgi:hypothetical protein
VPGDERPIGFAAFQTPHCFQPREWNVHTDRPLNVSAQVHHSAPTLLQSSFAPPSAQPRELSLSRAHCQGFSPHRDITGGVPSPQGTREEVPNPRSVSVHRLSQPLDGLIRPSGFAGLFHPAATSRVQSRLGNSRSKKPFHSRRVELPPCRYRCGAHNPRRSHVHDHSASASRLCSAWRSVLPRR